MEVKPLKFDEQKPMLHLVPPLFTRVLARIFEYGVGKYWRDSWQGFSLEKAQEDLIPAAMRHIDQYREGEFLDKESGYPHLGHAAWNLLVVMWHEYKSREM